MANQRPMYDWIDKQEYFRLAGHFYYDHEFDSLFEKKIWLMHSNGMSYRDISLKVRTKKNRANKDKIRGIISRLADIMKSKIK